MTTFSIPCNVSVPGNGENQAVISENTHTALEATKSTSSDVEAHTDGLIADLAWILLLGAIVTILFKKLKQPIVLGYIIAGFLASPKFAPLPSISNLDNIDFWAELGIVILMFTLGLEFSFKKLVNAGSSAIFTAMIIIAGMTFAGYGVGHLLDLDSINCIFLGGMLSMSSTTIILKALTDLGLKGKKFASLVLAVLIIEDLFAVLMLVLLSSLAMGDVNGSELLFSVGKLLFFLIIWFVVGVYVLPTFLHKTSHYLNGETLLIISMGLCFGMAVLSVWCGFSLELGAFVTGSVLAGTILAERIERVVQPVKDLFGAVFFISVGMMVDPTIIVQYWGEILLIAAVVVVGMTIFGTVGMLATGQNLRVAMEAGFSLTQIGEFSFIIASLGMSLGVLKPTLYPVIVAVSVITIFTTPYFIRFANPAYKFVERILPERLQFLINRYSKQPVDSDEIRQVWKDVLSRYLWRIVLYSVIVIGIMLASRTWLFPTLENIWQKSGHLIATIIMLIAMSPFLGALSFSSTKPRERAKLHKSDTRFEVPLLVMRIIRYLIALFLIIYAVSQAYTMNEALLVGLACLIMTLIFFSSKVTGRYHNIEKKFMDNLNARENVRLGRNNNLVDDLHQAYIEVGPGSPFVGDRIADSGLRRDYGVSVSSINRGMERIPLPKAEARIFPGDILGIIGTDSQIKQLNDDVLKSQHEHERRNTNNKNTVELRSVILTKNSPIVGKPLRDSRVREDFNAMIVKIRPANTDTMESPLPGTSLQPGDTLWIVGDPKQIQRLK